MKPRIKVPVKVASSTQSPMRLGIIYTKFISERFYRERQISLRP